MKSKKILIIGVCALALGTLIGVSIYAYMRKNQAPAAPEPKEVVKEFEYNVPDESGRYINDVAYDDGIDISDKCLEYPFKKSENYVPNRELVKKADKAFFAYSESFARDFLTGLLGTGYRAVGEDPSGYVKEMLPYFNETYTFTTGAKTRRYAKDILTDFGQWISDNKVQADIEVKTAGYLIYQDAYVFIRGELIITPYSCDADVMPEFIQGYDLKNGGRYVFELGCMPSVNDEKAMNVVSFTILGDA